MDCACARELLINGQIVLTMAIIIPVNLMYQRVLLALYTVLQAQIAAS